MVEAFIGFVALAVMVSVVAFIAATISGGGWWWRDDGRSENNNNITINTGTNDSLQTAQTNALMGIAAMQMETMRQLQTMRQPPQISQQPDLYPVSLPGVKRMYIGDDGTRYYIEDDNRVFTLVDNERYYISAPSTARQPRITVATPPPRPENKVTRFLTVDDED